VRFAVTTDRPGRRSIGFAEVVAHIRAEMRDESLRISLSLNPGYVLFDSVKESNRDAGRPTFGRCGDSGDAWQPLILSFRRFANRHAGITASQRIIRQPSYYAN
jgi:hypothetical protein